MKEQINKKDLPGHLIHLHEFMCKYYDDNHNLPWGTPYAAVLDYYSNITLNSFIEMESLLWFPVMVCNAAANDYRAITQKEDLMSLLNKDKIKEFYILLRKDELSFFRSYCIFYVSAKAANMHFSDLYAPVRKQLKDKK